MSAPELLNKPTPVHACYSPLEHYTSRCCVSAAQQCQQVWVRGTAHVTTTGV